MHTVASSDVVALSQNCAKMEVGSFPEKSPAPAEHDVVDTGEEVSSLQT